MEGDSKMIKIKIISLFLIFLASFSAAANFTTEQVCRAGIATVMSKPLSIITVDKQKGDVLYLSYMRRSDSSIWRYKCQIKGFKIHWGSVDPNGTEGRWRTHPLDEKVTFKTGIDTITVDEGGRNKKSYKQSDF